jgi:hypothetical protein
LILRRNLDSADLPFTPPSNPGGHTLGASAEVELRLGAANGLKRKRAEPLAIENYTTCLMYWPMNPDIGDRVKTLSATKEIETPILSAAGAALFDLREIPRLSMRVYAPPSAEHPADRCASADTHKTNERHIRVPG